MITYDTLAALTTDRITEFHAEAARDRLIHDARSAEPRPREGRGWARMSALLQRAHQASAL
jgi:hypothetical protein